MTGSRTLLCSALLSAIGSSAFAATVTYSNTAPVLGTAGISNTTAGTSIATNVSEAYAEFNVSHYVAGDNAVKGQTFTTGGSSAGYTLNSITLKAPGYSSDVTSFDLDGAGSGVFTLRVVQMGSNDQTFLSNPGLTVLRSETASNATGATIAGGYQNSAGGPGTYVTFTLSSPVTLAANTVYGFDVGSTGTYNNGGDFFESLGTNNASAYVGGAAYISGSNGVPDGNNVAMSTGDRVFYANVAAVPEPAMLGLAGLAGIGFLRRRRA